MHTYIICIGSNCNRAESMLFARNELTVLFPSIRFADVEETEPFLYEHSPLFLNQVAKFSSRLDVEIVKQSLKQIEHKAGRRPEDKLNERVVLDIDLLKCDNMTLKPYDLARDYVVRGVHQIEND